MAVLRAAGELGLPVLIHTADPVAFFDPLDEHNERLEELGGDAATGGSADPGHPTFGELLDALDRLVGACPGTMFIGAHVGCHAEDLGAVGACWPAAELARRHRRKAGRAGTSAARRSAGWSRRSPTGCCSAATASRPTSRSTGRWWRFLETDDEHFAYVDEGRRRPRPVADHGAALPRTLLTAVYRDNAQRLLRL